jgi:hypothetical protein
MLGLEEHRCEFGFLLPKGEGQDEGKKKDSLRGPLTLASSDYAKDKLSRREREFLTKYTRARIFSQVGKKTELLAATTFALGL